MNTLILYTTEDGKSRIQLRAKDATVWLTQREMAELFAVSQDNVGLHLKNIYADQELERRATTEESSVVQTEGGREVRRNVTLYNLDAILAVGYRVRSPRGVQFRRWASTVLKEYLLKGFAMDDERLKNPDGRPDFFDEMLARIRDIRASEKRFYQKVRDLFALSVDYDKSERETQQFFATVQNLLLFAVTRKTAELRAKNRTETRIAFWKENVDQIIASNGFPLLTHAGSISHEEMKLKTNKLYLDFDGRRKAEEARQADLDDEAELKRLEDEIKHRPKN